MARPAAAKFKARVIKRITTPFLKLAPNRPYYLKFLKPLFEGKVIEGQANKNPPVMCEVMNFETGEIMEMIAGAVLVKELAAQYEGNNYVGKTFEITTHKSLRAKEGQSPYNLYNISEIAEPEGDDLAMLQGAFVEPEVEDDGPDPIKDGEVKTDGAGAGAHQAAPGVVPDKVQAKKK